MSCVTVDEMLQVWL